MFNAVEQNQLWVNFLHCLISNNLSFLYLSLFLFIFHLISNNYNSQIHRLNHNRTISMIVQMHKNCQENRLPRAKIFISKKNMKVCFGCTSFA